MKKQVLSALLILFVGFSSLLQLSAYVHENYDYGNYPYIRLIPPPPEVLAADFGSPLVTADIGLFAYYEAAPWTLNDVIPAFHNYTQYTNYVDGYVRVWSDVNETTFVGSEYYIDVSVRVRSDGWILAWLEDDQDKHFITHIGGDIMEPGWDDKIPGDYETCLSRAIYRVYHNAGVSWVGYDEILYYDYEFPDATRLMTFGVSFDGSGSMHYYFTVPSGNTVEAAWVCAGGYMTTGFNIQLDSVVALEFVTFNDYESEDITANVTVNHKYDVYVFKGGTHGLNCYIILWTS